MALRERQDPGGRFLNGYFRELIYGGVPEIDRSRKD